MGGKTRIGLAVLVACASANADVAVPGEGPLVRGVIEVRAERGELAAGEETLPLSRFLLVERDDGALIWARNFAGRMRGYRRLVHETRRPKLVELAKEAVRARDAPLARRLYEWAKREGLEGRDERVLRKRVENEEKKNRKVNEKRRAAVLRDEKNLKTALPDLLLARARLELDPPGDGLRILRELLELVPDHATALDLVADRVPENSPFRAPRAWLTWHLDLEPRGYALAPDDLMALRRARHHWRPDLYGLTADGLLVITPIRRLEMVAACTTNIRLARDALAELFATPTPKLRTKLPLTIHLFSNPQNFSEQVGYERASDLPPYFRWKLGHWSHREDVTRLHCPDRITDPANRPLAYTAVHETVRHWIWTRCPRFSDSEVAKSGPLAGYALVAGLPGFFGEGRYDAATGKADLARRDTPSLRLVKSQAAKNRLLPWRKFFLMDWNDVHAMNSNDPNLRGGKRKKGAVLLGHQFMMQGAAVCHYLYNADRGARRKALANFIANYYLGNQKQLNPRLAFGMAPEELGAAVVAWASG